MNTNKFLKIFNILMALSVISTVSFYYLIGIVNVNILVVITAAAFIASILIYRDIENNKNKLPL